MATKELIEAAKSLGRETDEFIFPPPVAFWYNPLSYAWPAHVQYLRRFGAPPKRVIFLGMNPGPWGMAQTGIPFGEVEHVRDWLGIYAPVGKPSREHPKRPVDGFNCVRSEVSGRRLWGLFAARFGRAESFFRDHLVLNYCPLVFMADTGRNITPDKLPSGATTKRLAEVCNQHLRTVFQLLEPDYAVGVGAFAEQRLHEVAPSGVRVCRVLHPSPASPAANRDWAGTVTRQLLELGVWR